MRTGPTDPEIDRRHAKGKLTSAADDPTMKTTVADKSASAAVTAYVTRFATNVGLRPVFPRLVVGMMREMAGWPVRNADGGGNVAYFSTSDVAEASIAAARGAFRAAHNIDWSAT